MTLMLTASEIEEFVRPDYADRDIMHNLEHIRRVQDLAHQIGEGHNYDSYLLMLGIYLHGIVYYKEDEIREFLQSKQLAQELIDRAIQIAWESQTDSTPQSIEGMLLHDAHLLEGGRTFIIVKSLVTGTARKQSLEETISFIEQKVLGQFKCYLPEAQKLYEQKEAFAQEFVRDLRRNL